MAERLKQRHTDGSVTVTGRQGITTGATDFAMPHCCVELAIVISFAAAILAAPAAIVCFILGYGG
jgi:hypothetical protein